MESLTTTLVASPLNYWLTILFQPFNSSLLTFLYSTGLQLAFTTLEIFFKANNSTLSSIFLITVVSPTDFYLYLRIHHILSNICKLTSQMLTMEVITLFHLTLPNGYIPFLLPAFRPCQEGEVLSHDLLGNHPRDLDTHLPPAPGNLCSHYLFQ